MILVFLSLCSLQTILSAITDVVLLDYFANNEDIKSAKSFIVNSGMTFYFIVKKKYQSPGFEILIERNITEPATKSSLSKYLQFLWWSKYFKTEMLN